MKILVLNNWHEGMRLFFDLHIDHAEHQVWYLCNEEGRRGVESALSPSRYSGITDVSDIMSHDEVLAAAGQVFEAFAFERVVAIDELTVLVAGGGSPQIASPYRVPRKARSFTTATRGK